MILLPLLAALASLAAAQDQWCGKNYMQNQPAVNPGGQFKAPAKSLSPLLNFRCWPNVQPFLEGDTAAASFIIDTPLTNLHIPGTQPFTLKSTSKPHPGNFTVTVQVGKKTIASGSVPVNSTGTELDFDLKALPVSMKAQTVACTASLSDGSGTFTTTTTVRHLPQPAHGGSVTKTDLRTGALLVRPGGSDQFEPIIPFGFYTSFDDYLATNLSVINNAKASGRNVIHPNPTFDNLTAFNEMLERMKEQQIYLMYDMRHTFMNLTSVQEETEMVMNYPYLLLWYTADEPDGWQYPHNSTRLAGDLIASLDPYHPISLVLNCFDYFFEEYTQGASIILQDTYTIEINATFSRVWGTPCNATLGDCGCDDCTGSFDDVATRVDLFHERLSVDGRSRGTSVWSVPQGFGNESYWPRYPTPNEFIVQSILALNHGSLGVVSWDEQPTMPPELLASAAILGHALPTITSFITSPVTEFASLRNQGNRLDVGVWSLAGKILILGTNLGTENATASLGSVLDGFEMTELLNTGAEFVRATEEGGEERLVFEGLGSIGMLFSPS